MGLLLFVVLLHVATYFFVSVNSECPPGGNTGDWECVDKGRYRWWENKKSFSGQHVSEWPDYEEKHDAHASFNDRSRHHYGCVNGKFKDFHELIFAWISWFTEVKPTTGPLSCMD